MRVAIKDLAKVRIDHGNKKVVFLAGTFDLLHVGHLTYLEEAAKFGDILVVGVNSDARTRRVKGSDRPIIKQSERVRLVSELKVVTYSFIMPSRESQGLRPTFQIIKRLRPDIFLVLSDSWLNSQSFYKKYNTETIVLKRIDKTSTSRIIKKIKLSSKETPVTD